MKQRLYNKEMVEKFSRMEEESGGFEEVSRVIKAYDMLMKEIEREKEKMPKVKGKKLKLFKNTKEAI